jgi:hypothetical protein
VRYVIIIAYCVFLAFGTYWIADHNGIEALTFIAKNDLPENRLLQQGDVVPGTFTAIRHSLWIGPGGEEFIGRYPTGHLVGGDSLRLEDTDVVPHLIVEPNRVLIVANLVRAKLDKVNAGSCVYLTGTGPNAFKVATVLCPSPSQAQCVAILSVAANDIAKLQTAAVGAALSIVDSTSCS